MKRLIILFLVLLFSLASVSGAECSPGSGFDWCYYEENANHGDAYCYAEVQGTVPICDGDLVGNKCAGRWYVNIGIGGDKGYIVKSPSDWSVHNNCNVNGCPSQYEIKPGDDTLQDTIGQPVPKYYITAWDYDNSGNPPHDPYYCWTAVSGGYIGDYFAGLSVVECVNDGNCESNEVCNNNVCEEQLPPGFCQSDFDCPIQIETTFYCSEGDIVKDTVQSGCQNNQCADDKYVDEGLLEQQCNFGCTQEEGQAPFCNEEPEPECTVDADCQEGFVCEENLCVEEQSSGTLLLVLSIIGGVILLGGLIFLYVVMRRR